MDNNFFPYMDIAKTQVERNLYHGISYQSTHNSFLHHSPYFIYVGKLDEPAFTLLKSITNYFSTFISLSSNASSLLSRADGFTGTISIDFFKTIVLFNDCMNFSIVL